MKRSLVAVLALSLALGGCGGSGKKDSASSSTSPSAPATSSAPAAGSTGSAGGASAVPTAPDGGGTAAATKKFNDCIRRQGVTMPSPHPKSTPSKAELAKIQTALKACVKEMTVTPATTPK